MYLNGTVIDEISAKITLSVTVDLNCILAHTVHSSWCAKITSLKTVYHQIISRVSYHVIRDLSIASLDTSLVQQIVYNFSFKANYISNS